MMPGWQYGPGMVARFDSAPGYQLRDKAEQMILAGTKAVRQLTRR